MDSHTLELLEFEKIRTLVAARAACSLGKEGARRLEPSRDIGEIRQRQALTTEMADALSAGLTPPFGGLHDIRPNVRRAQVGAIWGVASAIEGCMDRRGNILDTASRRLSALRREIGQVEERIQETLRR